MIWNWLYLKLINRYNFWQKVFDHEIGLKYSCLIVAKYYYTCISLKLNKKVKEAWSRVSNDNISEIILFIIRRDRETNEILRGKKDSSVILLLEKWLESNWSNLLISNFRRNVIFWIFYYVCSCACDCFNKSWY